MNLFRRRNREVTPDRMKIRTFNGLTSYDSFWYTPPYEYLDGIVIENRMFLFALMKEQKKTPLPEDQKAIIVKFKTDPRYEKGYIMEVQYLVRIDDATLRTEVNFADTRVAVLINHECLKSGICKRIVHLFNMKNINFYSLENVNSEGGTHRKFIRYVVTRSLVGTGEVVEYSIDNTDERLNYSLDFGTTRLGEVKSRELDKALLNTAVSFTNAPKI